MIYYVDSRVVLCVCVCVCGLGLIDSHRVGVKRVIHAPVKM